MVYFFLRFFLITYNTDTYIFPLNLPFPALEDRYTIFGTAHFSVEGFKGQVEAL